MNLELIIEILNKYKHLNLDTWEVVSEGDKRASRAGITSEIGVVDLSFPNCPSWIGLTRFEASAIAEKYIRDERLPRG